MLLGQPLPATERLSPVRNTAVRLYVVLPHAPLEGVAGQLYLQYDHRPGGAHLDKHLVRQYRERWRAVEAADLAELRRSSVAWRFSQMEAIYRLAAGLHLTDQDSSEEDAAVYERWAHLKRRLG
jgi:hypothetical protein